MKPKNAWIYLKSGAKVLLFFELCKFFFMFFSIIFPIYYVYKKYKKAGVFDNPLLLCLDPCLLILHKQLNLSVSAIILNPNSL